MIRERVWNTSNINKSEWRRQDIEGANTHITDSRQYSYSVASGDNGTILRGYLRPVYLMDFSVSGGGNVRVGTTYGSSIEDIEVVESNPVTAEVLPLYDQNGIDFYFKEWSDNNTSNPRTFLQQVMPPILLQELAIATTASMNVHFVGSAGDPISIDWDDHPNTNVTQYQVWRCDDNYPYPNGRLVATRSRGNTSYTDDTYIYYDGSGTTENLKYAVIAYYSPEGTWGTKSWSTIQGEEEILHKADSEQETDEVTITREKIEYTLVNNPNPFNPATVINYSIGATEPVTIKVYNMLGKEVATLVNGVQRAGEHRITFDGRNLASGVYIYTIQTPSFATSKKMILMK